MHKLEDTKSVIFTNNGKEHEVVYRLETVLDNNGDILYIDCPHWIHYGYDEINGFEKMFEGKGPNSMPVEVLSHYMVIEKQLEVKYAKE